MKKENISPDMFKPLTLPQKDMSDSTLNRYRVYSDYKTFVSVEADNAQDALVASGIAKAHRIVREDMIKNAIVKVVAGTKKDAPVEKPVVQVAVESTPTEAAPVENTEAAAAPVPETPLSNEDVNKLLQG